MAGKIRDKRIGLALGWGLLALVVTSVLLGGSGDSVEARKYGHRHYKKYNYKSQIGRCKSACARTSASIHGCEVQGRKGLIKNCKTAFKASQADCSGDGQCKANAKQALKACLGTARGGSSSYLHNEARYCGRCCQRTHGSSGCISAFQGDRFYGAYRSHGRLFCPTPGSPSGAFVDVSDRIRQGLARLVPWAIEGWTD